MRKEIKDPNVHAYSELYVPLSLSLLEILWGNCFTDAHHPQPNCVWSEAMRGVGKP